VRHLRSRSALFDGTASDGSVRIEKGYKAEKHQVVFDAVFVVIREFVASVRGAPEAVRVEARKMAWTTVCLSLSLSAFLRWRLVAAVVATVA